MPGAEREREREREKQIAKSLSKISVTRSSLENEDIKGFAPTTCKIATKCE